MTDKILILTSIFLINIGFSQNINIDSLKNTGPDTIKINILTENKDSMQSSSDEKYAEIFISAHASIERWHVIRTGHIESGIEMVVKEAPGIVPYLLKLAKNDRTVHGWPYWALLCGSLKQAGGEQELKMLQELASDENAGFYVREWAKRALEDKLIAPDER